MKEHIDTITDLLLGAAYSDKRLEGNELASIRDMLGKILGVDELPTPLRDRLKVFNPAKFNIQTATATLQELSIDDKRTIMDLIATVSEADDVTDLDEDAYLRRVAAGLGIPDEDIESLEIEILDDDDLAGILDDDDLAEFVS